MTWQTVAVSETKTQVKAILGNQVTIDAYKASRAMGSRSLRALNG